MNIQIVLAIFSTSAVSALIGGVVAGSFVLRAKQAEYVNDYYKTVINRRLAAYEQLERLIIELKTSIVEEIDKRPYHRLFSSESDDTWPRAFFLLNRVMDQGLWLSDEAFIATRDLNYLLFRFTKPTSVIEFAKNNYQAMATIRDRLERLLAKDMLNLHNVERFLKSKDKPDPGFHPVHLRR